MFGLRSSTRSDCSMLCLWKLCSCVAQIYRHSHLTVDNRPACDPFTGSLCVRDPSSVKLWQNSGICLGCTWVPDRLRDMLLQPIYFDATTTPLTCGPVLAFLSRDQNTTCISEIKSPCPPKDPYKYLDMFPPTHPTILTHYSTPR